MGVQGFRRWLETQNCSRIPQGGAQSMDHVFLDMNGLIHTVYDRTKPTRSDTCTSLLALLDRIFARFVPKKSINVIFDGPSPLAKLATQRERRRQYRDVDYGRPDALAECEITTGSSFMLSVEEAVEAHLVKRLTSSRNPSSNPSPDLFLSGTRVPGEGETKISRRILELSLHRDTYCADDRLCIVGNDTDLVLHGIAATPYHNIFVVHPFSFVVTCVGDLLLSWTRGNNSGTQMSLKQLPSARLDFVFLAQFAGCDHYDGIEGDAWSAWRVYRTLRSAGGPFAGDVRLLHPVSAGASTPSKDAVSDDTVHLVINHAFLRAVLLPKPSPGGNAGGGHSGGGGAAKSGTKWRQARSDYKKQQSSKQKGSVDVGKALCEAALWSMNNSCFGLCRDYTYRWKGHPGNVHALRAVVASANVSKLRSPCGPTTLPPLTPLRTYTAIQAKPKYYSPTVRQVVENSPDSANHKKLPQFESIAKVLDGLDQLFAIIPESSFTAFEKKMMSFGVPKLYRRTTRDGGGSVEKIDPFVVCLDPAEEAVFVNFAYSKEQLVDGIRIADPFSDTTSLLKLSKRQMERLYPDDHGEKDNMKDEADHADTASSAPEASEVDVSTAAASEATCG